MTPAGGPDTDPARPRGLDDDTRTPTAPAGLPPGRAVHLPGRGTTWVHEHPGPVGAPTLVLLHGWTATGALNWFSSIPALGERYRVVTIDHRGHGRGIHTSRRFRLEDCADDVVSLADELGIDRFVPVGYSMGGPVAQLVWHRYPERVAGLVLCATSRNFRGRPVERALFSALTGLSLAARITPVGWQSTVGERVIGRRIEEGNDLAHWARSEMRRNDPRAIVEAGQAIGAFNSRDWIGGVDVPTALVVTELDSVVPTARQEKLAAAIPGASVHLAPGDHGVCVTEPADFVPPLLDACASVATRARRLPATS
jgi:3-oxoadipate enol-lactonase